MSNSSALRNKPEATNKPTPEPTGASTGDIFWQAPAGGTDPHVPILLNLSAIQAKMESLQRFLSNSVNDNIVISKDQMEMVSSEIASAVEQIILNGAALLASCHHPSFPTQPEEIAQELPVVAEPPPSTSSVLNEQTTKGAADLNLDLKLEEIKEENESDELEIIELSAEQLLGERKHYCDLCGRGFKRYANLRMHIRSHGRNQFKTSEAEIRSLELWQKTRFSCPFLGCDRNKSHDKFRPLKSVVCVKNHFRRSHCPKMYSCTRCNNKSFSVLADLKSHLKHCGESSKFRCSCGTSFSRRDKLLGHMASFKGHMPAPAPMEEDYKARGVSSMVEDGENENDQMGNCSDHGFFMGLFEQFASIENYCLQGELSSAPPDC